MYNITHNKLLAAICQFSIDQPSKIALIARNKSVTYFELWKNILGTARYLQTLGLTKHDRILLAARKEIEFVYIYFASQLLGVVNVIIDSDSNDTRLCYVIDTINPKVIFGIDGGVAYSDICHDGVPEIQYDISCDDVAEILFTTGTTGSPKGVQLSYANIIGAANNINNYIGNTSEDVELLGLPICHSFGLGRLRCNMLKGATFILLGSFANLQIVFSTIEKYHVTGFGMVPAVWEYIIRLSGEYMGRYAAQIKYIEIGSAPMGIDNKKLLLKIFPTTRICMHYGSTEASRSLFMEFHEYEGDLDTIGKPVSSNVDVKICDDSGVSVSDGQIGELCVRGNMVLKSYVLEKDNENAFWGEYFRTGDYGYKLESGNFYLVGRKKEIINVGGKKVSPVEVENAILSLGGVSDCICVPVTDPSGLLGEVPKVYILREGTVLSLKEVSEKLKGKLEQYKLPVEYEWIEKIPKTSSGKKQRLSLCHN